VVKRREQSGQLDGYRFERRAAAAVKGLPMTEERAEGAAYNIKGKLQEGFGALTGDSKVKLEGSFNQARGTAMDYYGRAVDALESQIERAPANVQPQARKAIAFSRERPLVTVLGIAALGLFLTRGSRR
jgi:uncharacterized protein YjbJ (UPF0337 family)